MIATACTFFAVSAQYPMVTLSHNGELSFFDDLYAFDSALNSAENGDTIYLSEGDYIVNSGSVVISKRVSIVGTGYGSHILGHLSINMRGNINSHMDAPLVDGVRIYELDFTTDYGSRNNLESSVIRCCYIDHLNNLIFAGNEVTVDRCYIEKIDCNSSYTPGGVTVTLKNSKINIITNMNNFSSTVLNCNVKESYYFPTTMISSIWNTGDETRSNSTGSTIINSLLRKAAPNGVYTFDSYIVGEDVLDDNLESTLDLLTNNYLGKDGTIVGAYGGDTPFSELPSVPTVDSGKSSVEYDAENNKLKVTIAVAEN